MWQPSNSYILICIHVWYIYPLIYHKKINIDQPFMLFKYTGPVPWMVWEQKLEPSKNRGLEPRVDHGSRSRNLHGWRTFAHLWTIRDDSGRFWPTKKELLKTRPYLADPSTGHPLCSFVRDPNEVLDILDRSWRTPVTVWFVGLIPEKLDVSYGGWDFFWMTGLEFGPIVFGFYLKLDLLRVGCIHVSWWTSQKSM